MASPVSRREFLATSAVVGTTAIVGAPFVATAAKTDSSDLIIGEGDFTYRVHDLWPQLPSQYSWQTTHNVAVDNEGLVYIIHEGKKELADHPSIFVFDGDGKFVRAFGQEFQGGGHGIEVREENGEQFLYIAAYKHLKTFAKLDLKGKTIWQKFAPMKSGVYADGEAKNPQDGWGRDRFLPTNFAFLPGDAGFLLADGYGSYYIHHYTNDGDYVKSFGGPGAGEGKFATPHGLWVDTRSGKDPEIVITDRAHHTIQFFTLEGEYLRTKTGFGLPANIDTWRDLLLVPELVARVSILDHDNNVVAQLGTDVDRVSADKKRTIRRDESKWIPGKFVHPHDGCFDQSGNIYVPEWVQSGRVTKLERLS